MDHDIFTLHNFCSLWEEKGYGGGANVLFFFFFFIYLFVPFQGSSPAGRARHTAGSPPGRCCSPSASSACLGAARRTMQSRLPHRPISSKSSPTARTPPRFRSPPSTPTADQLLAPIIPAFAPAKIKTKSKRETKLYLVGETKSIGSKL